MSFYSSSNYQSFKKFPYSLRGNLNNKSRACLKFVDSRSLRLWKFIIKPGN